MSQSLTQSLAGTFVIANLGAGGDSDYALSPKFLKAMTLIELDGGSQGALSGGTYFAKHFIHEVVSGEKTAGRFTRRKYWGCSSLYEPYQELVKIYGLEKFFEVDSISEVTTTTLPAILEELEISSVDFLKTDLEGADFEVIKSIDKLLPFTWAIKCELRFQPFYEEEPYFHEVAQYLHERGFELINMRPEYWKPKTLNRKEYGDGRLVWADCLFMKKPAALLSLPGEIRPLAQAKQIIIASMLGKRCYARWLYETYLQSFSDEWKNDLEHLVAPARNSHNRIFTLRSGLHRIVNGIIRRINSKILFQHKQAADSETFEYPHLSTIENN